MHGSPEILRRLSIAARAPGLDAPALAAIARLSPDFELLESRHAHELGAVAVAPRAIAYFRSPEESLIESDLRWLEGSGCSVLPCTAAAYPSLLRAAPDAPPVLYVRGAVQALAEPQIAMVGSRSATAGGLATARRFAAAFARTGLGVTSGLALGIDAASHEGALDAQGITIAVLGHGLDILYPRQHRALAARIVADGALVSEFPPGTPPRAANFPQRNRIIAGLTHGTVVVEAALDSGSLITARLAGVAGREVFAVPGSIQNPMVRGCHELIRQGAKLIEGVEDVLAELKISLSSQLLAGGATAPSDTGKPGGALDKEYKILLDALAFEPASVDSLIERTGMNSESIASMLLILELDGYVAPHPGGRYSRLAER